MALRFCNEKIGQSPVGIEADYPHRISDKIGERVHVVVKLPAGSLIENVFNAADFHSREFDDALYVFDDLSGRLIPLDFHARLWRVHGAGDACELLAARVLANIRGTQVEAFAGDMNSDGVKIFAAEHLDGVKTAMDGICAALINCIATVDAENPSARPLS